MAEATDHHRSGWPFSRKGFFLAVESQLAGYIGRRSG
jgi:hypothetical protein